MNYSVPFFLSIISVKAANPGATYGCLVWNNALYTNYWKDDAYSNWGGVIIIMMMHLVFKL